MRRLRLDVRWLSHARAKPTEAFDAGQFAAQRNARNLLFTLFVQASLVEQPGDGDKMLLEAVKAALTS